MLLLPVKAINSRGLCLSLGLYSVRASLVNIKGEKKGRGGEFQTTPTKRPSLPYSPTLHTPTIPPPFILCLFFGNIPCGIFWDKGILAILTSSRCKGGARLYGNRSVVRRRRRRASLHSDDDRYARNAHPLNRWKNERGCTLGPCLTQVEGFG